MRVLVVARGRSVVPGLMRARLAEALAAWRAGGGGAWERFVFLPNARFGFGVVVVPDEAALRRLVEACPLAPFCALETLEVEPATANAAPAGGRVVGLRDARRARGWTQAALAERAGLSPTTVTRIERGKGRPSAVVARRLGAALALEPHLVVELRPAVADRARSPLR